MALNNPPADSFANHALLNHLQTQLEKHGRKFLCAFSGGLDSTVLLHAAARIPGLQLRAVHIHHGLHADADRWTEHCIEACRELGIELEVIRVEVKKDEGKGTEAAARHARYQAIAKHIGNDEILLTAHHRQDQAETLLLRLLRGSGSHGLAAMRALSSSHGFQQLRPLLSVAKAELQAYAEAGKLSWIEDPSNSKTDFDRNFLRHEIMPMLEKRWPHAIDGFARSAELLAQEHQCLREQSLHFLAQVQGVDERALSLAALMQHSKAWRAQILRAWTESLATAPLPAHLLQEIELTLLTARPDAEAHVQWSGSQMTRWRDCLYLSAPEAEIPGDWQQAWNGSDTVNLPNGDQWFFESAAGVTGIAENIQKEFAGDLWIRPRQGGEKILLEKRLHHSIIKNCLQELGVPPWERRRLPLVFSAAGECLAVGDVLLSARFEAFCRAHGTRFSRKV